MDPNGTGAARLATDVLWSDPLLDPGFHFNTTRNIGMVFGPDVTQARRAADGSAGKVVEPHLCTSPGGLLACWCTLVRMSFKSFT